MNNKTTSESATKIGEGETGSYLQLFLYRVPKKNNEAIAKNLKQFVSWFKEHGARVECYELGLLDAWKKNMEYTSHDADKLVFYLYGQEIRSDRG